MFYNIGTRSETEDTRKQCFVLVQSKNNRISDFLHGCVVLENLKRNGKYHQSLLERKQTKKFLYYVGYPSYTYDHIKRNLLLTPPFLLLPKF